jgi:hypothetical protein
MCFIKPFPGGDTPGYVNSIHFLENRGIIASLYLEQRPLVSILLYSLYLVIPVPDYLTRITFTIVAYNSLSSFLLGFFSFLLLRELGVERITASLCVIGSYVTWIFRYGDIYANYFAYALMFALAYFYLNFKKNNWYGALGGIIVVMIFLTHEPTAYIATIIIALSTILLRVYCKNELKSIRFPTILMLFTASIILLPFIFLALNDVGYLGVFSTFLGPVEERYGITSLPISLFKKISSDNWDIAMLKPTLSGSPHIIGYILTLLGLVLTRIAFRRKHFSHVLILLQSWCFILLTGILIGSIPSLFGEPFTLSGFVWRLAYLMPYPLLLGSVAITPIMLPPATTVIISPSWKIHFNRREISFILLALIALMTFLNFNISIQYAYYYSDTPRPSESVINDALAIRNIFGYGNRSVILYVQNNEGRKIEWISAITGMNIFYGKNILDLYLGKLDETLYNDIIYVVKIRYLIKTGLFGNITKNVKIVTSESFAILHPPESELVSQMISVRGGSRIYIFREVDKELINNLLALYNTSNLLGQPLNNGESFWGIYRGGGGRWDVNISKTESATQRYKVTLIEKGEGNYYIRLYHIFEKPIDLSLYQYIRIIVSCNLQNGDSKTIHFTLSSANIPGAGGTGYNSIFTFTCVSGERKTVLIPLRDLKREPGFNISSVKQFIISLDADKSIGDITISDITIIPLGEIRK